MSLSSSPFRRKTPSVLSRRSDAGSHAFTTTTRAPPNMKLNEILHEIRNIINTQKERSTVVHDNSLERSTVVHFADESITLPDLYGLVLQNTKALELVVDSIESIITTLLDCIREETIGNH